MNSEYTAILKQDEGWWIGWIEEVSGVNCQERTKAELVESLHEALSDVLECNREQARACAGEPYFEEGIVL